MGRFFCKRRGMVPMRPCGRPRRLGGGDAGRSVTSGVESHLMRVVTAVILMALIPAAPVAASKPPPSHLFEVSSHGTRVVDLRLPSVSIDWSRLSINAAVSKFAGLYFEPRDPGKSPRRGTGGIVSDMFRYDSAPSLVFALGLYDFPFPVGDGARFGKVTKLPAGSYRLHVIADGEVTLTLPLVGLAHSMRLRAASASQDAVRLKELDPSIGVAAPGAAVGDQVLPSGTSGVLRTLTILRTHGSAQRMPGDLGGCRRSQGSTDAPCEGVDSPDGIAMYDSSRRDFVWVPPVPFFLPMAGASTYIYGAFYEHRLGAATQLGYAATADMRDSAAEMGIVITFAK